MLGFAREMLMAAALGTGPVAEAFYAAFQFPNTFRRLFAEGAFNAAFVPLFAREIEAGGVEGAKKFSEEVFGVLFGVLLALTIAMELAMPLVVTYVIAPGFASSPEKLSHDHRAGDDHVPLPHLHVARRDDGGHAELAAPLLRRCHRAGLPQCHPRRHPCLCLERRFRRPEVGYALAWGVLAAGLVQLAIVWVAVRHAGVSIGFRRPRLTPNVKRLLWLALPAAITGGITQINTVIGTAIASGRAGAVPSLNLADRVYQLPLGVVGVAVGVVLLPELARALRAGHLKDAANLQNRSVEFTLFLTLPAAAALLVMSEPIVRLLYERGAFTPDDTLVVAEILAIFGLGLPAFVLIKAFTPGYFAREDTRTPMIFAALSVAINITVALTLFPSMGAPGIAVASAVAGWVNAALLLGVLVRRGHWASDAALLSRIPRLVLAAGVMAAALLCSGQPTSPTALASSAHFVTQATTLGGDRHRGDGDLLPVGLRDRRRRFRHDPAQHQARRRAVARQRYRIGGQPGSRPAHRLDTQSTAPLKRRSRRRGAWSVTDRHHLALTSAVALPDILLSHRILAMCHPTILTRDCHSAPSRGSGRPLLGRKPAGTGRMNGRLYYIDWLRVSAFAILIVYHCSVAFFPDMSWLLKSAETSATLSLVMDFPRAWRLALLFFISGMGTWFAFRSSGGQGFLKDRAVRLGVPLLFAMCVIVVPQVWYERMYEQGYQGSFLTFWTERYFTEGKYPTGNFTWAHMWFVAYLLVMAVVCYPIFRLLMQPRMRPLADWFERTAQSKARLSLLPAAAGAQSRSVALLPARDQCALQ